MPKYLMSDLIEAEQIRNELAKEAYYTSRRDIYKLLDEASQLVREIDDALIGEWDSDYQDFFPVEK